MFASFAKGHGANGNDRAPLLNGDEGVDARREADGGGEEQMYSYLERRLRPLFYQLVSFAVAFGIMCALSSRGRHACIAGGSYMYMYVWLACT